MDTHRTWSTTSAEETGEIGKQLALFLNTQSSERGAHIVCLWGQLGSGKTTFAQGFARGLGISQRVLSPTFIIVRRYEMGDSTSYFYHLDLYRIESGKEILNVGFKDMVSDQTAIIIIEWPERLGRLLPTRRYDVHFAIGQGDDHIVELKKVS